MDIKRHLVAFFPESPSYLGLNELTMKFRDERESAYIEHNLEHFMSQKRLGLIFGVLMFAIFALLDLVLAPKAMGPLFFIRFGITAALLFFVLSLSYIDRLRPYFHKILFASVLIMNLSHLIAFTKLPPDLLPKYHFSYLILIVYSSFMMATNFLNTALAVALSVFFYIGYLSFSPAILTGDKLLFSAVSLVLSVIVVLAIYYTEYLSRRSYILESRLGGALDKGEESRSGEQGAELKAEDKAEVSPEIGAELRAKISAELEESYALKEERLKKELELERKNNSILEKELEELRLAEYEKYQSREAAFLREKEALLKDKDGAYEGFKKGIKKDYESNLNQLRRELKARESSLKELETLNKTLMADLDRTMAENKELRDQEQVKIGEKSFDDIKLMGRISSYASGCIVKNVVENLNYFEENQEEFKSACSLQYISDTGNKLRENLNLAGAMKYRFDLFRLFLENSERKDDSTEVASSIQRAFSQLSRYFEGTGHFIDVTCKDGVYVRMREEALDLILQNLVMTSLSSAAMKKESAHILISVTEHKSKVLIEYRDESEKHFNYYKEILKMKHIHSDIVSVSGIEVFFIRDLIKRANSGELVIESKGGVNKLVMSFIK